MVIINQIQFLAFQSKTSFTFKDTNMNTKLNSEHQTKTRFQFWGPLLNLKKDVGLMNDMKNDIQDQGSGKSHLPPLFPLSGLAGKFDALK